ncbi:hypothetical protein BaRGS_00022835, partial [Batillaria attramentaria]
SRARRACQFVKEIRQFSKCEKKDAGGVTGQGYTGKWQSPAGHQCTVDRFIFCLGHYYTDCRYVSGSHARRQVNLFQADGNSTKAKRNDRSMSVRAELAKFQREQRGPKNRSVSGKTRSEVAAHTTHVKVTAAANQEAGHNRREAAVPPTEWPLSVALTWSCDSTAYGAQSLTRSGRITSGADRYARRDGCGLSSSISHASAADGLPCATGCPVVAVARECGYWGWIA